MAVETSAEAGASAGERVRRMRKDSRPLPAEFAEVAPTLNYRGMRKRYGVGTSTLCRWMRQAGLPPGRGRYKGIPLPADLAHVAPTLTRSQLMQRYGVKRETLRQWLKTVSVEPLPAVERRTAPIPARTKGRAFRPGGAPWAKAPSVAPLVTLADQAATHLRRVHTAVFRSEIDPVAAKRAGLPDKGKGFYFVAGKGHLPTADMIALAEAKGFDRQAWARI